MTGSPLNPVKVKLLNFLAALLLSGPLSTMPGARPAKGLGRLLKTN